jgi:GntR family transcriptional regulator/MocR family aminotransferase
MPPELLRPPETPSRPGDSASRRAWVYRRVMGAIADGSLAPGTRLPSARWLASQWEVARGAIDDALAQLQREGLLERRVGDGTYVSALLPSALKGLGQGRQRRANTTSLRMLARVKPLFEARGGQAKAVEVYDDIVRPRALRASMPALDVFPLALWRKLMLRAYDDPLREVLSYGAEAGLPQLRDATARYLRLTRSMACSRDQVLILNSPQQAIELALQVLLEPGDKVCVQDPGHISVPRIVELARLVAVGVPVDEQGFDVAAARRLAPDAAALYLHPSNAFPLGINTSAARREELLRWAEEIGAWVIEGDYFGEIVHEREALPTLARSDKHERVLHVGTFTSVMFPSLRLAYLVVPERLVPVFSAVRGLLGEHTETASQVAMAAFIDSGAMSDHLRTLRLVYRQRRDRLLAVLQQALPAGARIGPSPGGIHVCVHLPDSLNDSDIVRRLAECGVDADALSEHAWQATGCNALVLGYGAYDEAAIDAAGQTVGSVLHAAQASVADAALLRRSGSAAAPSVAVWRGP